MDSQNQNKIKGEPKKESSFKKMLDFNPFKVSRENAHKWLPFILYLTLWAVIYISNRHYAEKTELQIKSLKEELKEYRAEYLTIKSEMMFKTKQSQVAKMVDSLGLQELTEPPEKLRVKIKEE